MIQKARINQEQIYFYQFLFGIFGYNGPNCRQIETDGKFGDGRAKWVTLQSNLILSNGSQVLAIFLVRYKGRL